MHYSIMGSGSFDSSIVKLWLDVILSDDKLIPYNICKQYMDFVEYCLQSQILGTILMVEAYHQKENNNNMAESFLKEQSQRFDEQSGMFLNGLETIFSNIILKKPMKNYLYSIFLKEFALRESFQYGTCSNLSYEHVSGGYIKPRVFSELESLMHSVTTLYKKTGRIIIHQVLRSDYYITEYGNDKIYIKNMDTKEKVKPSQIQEIKATKNPQGYIRRFIYEDLKNGLYQMENLNLDKNHQPHVTCGSGKSFYQFRNLESMIFSINEIEPIGFAAFAPYYG